MAILQRRDDAARVLRLLTAELSVEDSLIEFRLDAADTAAASSSGGLSQHLASSSSSSASSSTALLKRTLELNERDASAAVGTKAAHSVCLRALVHALDALRRPETQVCTCEHDAGFLRFFFFFFGRIFSVFFQPFSDFFLDFSCAGFLLMLLFDDLSLHFRRGFQCVVCLYFVATCFSNLVVF